MVDYSRVSYCDSLQLSKLIEKRIVIPLDKKHSKIQEFARLMGQKSWRSPANIYDIINNRRKPNLEWTIKAAGVLGVQAYELLPRWLIAHVVEGFFDELNRNEAPDSILKALRKKTALPANASSYSRIFHSEVLMKDRSMEPEIVKGDVVKVLAVDALESGNFVEGQVYYVEHVEGLHNIRQVFYDNDLDRYLLRATNPRVSLVAARVEEIKSMFPIIKS